MKCFSQFLALLLICLLVISCAGCHADEPPLTNPDTQKEENTTVPRKYPTEEALLNVNTEINADDIIWGTPIEELLPLLKPEENIFWFQNYVLFLDCNGDLVVVQHEETGVRGLRKYSMPFDTVTDADFASVAEGMTFYELIERVGPPLGMYTSGVLSLDFQTTDGTRYRVEFEQEYRDRFYIPIVKSVCLR